MKKVLIIMPAYNEGKNLPSLLEKLSDGSIKEIGDVLVINDASEDDTRDIVLSYGFTKVTNIFNLGYGSSLQIGYKYAIRYGYEYVIQLDSDGQHDVVNILRIYEALLAEENVDHKPDIVIGSRFLKGSQAYKISWIKKISIKWFSFLIKSTTGEKITDPTSGLQGLRRSAFLYYSQYNNFDYNYPDANMVIQMLLLGFKVTEVPSIMKERTEGESMHSGIIKPMLYMTIMPISIWNTVIRIKSGLQKVKKPSG